jgi:hypothetical protein
MRRINTCREIDRRLAEQEEPPLGAHLVTPRTGFVHHGIYVGEGRVIHYGAVDGFIPNGPVEEVALSCFRRGRAIAVRSGLPVRFTTQEVIGRARSRAGENRYRLFSNNCEHFCEWCLRGEHRSYQVDELFAFWSRIWQRVIQTLARIILGVSTGAINGPNILGALILNGARVSPPTSCSVTWPVGRLTTRRRFTPFGSP